MNVHVTTRCKDCRTRYIVCAPSDYADSGRCPACDDEAEWLNKHMGADAGIFRTDVMKERQPDQWGAFMGLMAVLFTAACVSYGVWRFVGALHGFWKY